MAKSGHVSNETKRQILAVMDKLFETECRRIPLTDHEITSELIGQGIDVNVTSVAYYRETYYQLPNYMERAKLYRQQQGAKGAKNGKS